jgi:hypothetical protein
LDPLRDFFGKEVSLVRSDQLVRQLLFTTKIESMNKVAALLYYFLSTIICYRRKALLRKLDPKTSKITLKLTK